MKKYTGPFSYKDKDKDKIDTVKEYQMADLKTFKQAKRPDLHRFGKLTNHTQIDEPYQRFKSGKDV